MLKVKGVKCNKCDWKDEQASISKWVNKNCPKCKKCIIVTEQEIAILDTFDDFLKKILEIVKDIRKGQLKDIKIDIAPLRENKPAKIELVDL